MQKLIPVEDAKAIMREANDWSLWGWLTKKPQLRRTADAAWEALEAVEQRVKGNGGDDLKKAYRELEAQAAVNGNSRSKRQYEKAQEEAKDLDPQLKLAVQRVKEADDEWHEARRVAEDTFDQAERSLSTSMACEGTQQAIRAWELTERAIRRAEALARRSTVHNE